MHRLVHRIDRQYLPENVTGVGRDARKIAIGNREISHQFGFSKRGRLLGIKLAAKSAAHGINQTRPLCV